MRLLILSSLFASSVLGTHYSPTVQTKFGVVRGLLSDPFPDHDEEKRAEVFLGLPYALPPIGPLRFEKPQPYNLSWIYEREATQFGPGCVPLINLFGLPIDEDCLTLNIFRPPLTTNRKLPVLTYLHGGGFGFGLSGAYGYQNLSNNFVSRDLIVITVNYRLGVYGFGSTGDHQLPGNLGLWDQALAFKWIYENVESFGGDPSRITAWGLSAGAGSIGLLTLSPHSQKFISQTIEMSGPATAPWAVSDETVDFTSQLAAYIGCPPSDSKGVKKCLLSKPQSVLYQATTTFTKPSPKLLQFTPRIDGDFLPRPLADLIRDAPKIATLSGVTQAEAYYFTILNKDLPINSIAVQPSRFHDYGLRDLDSFITRLAEVFAPLLGEHKEQGRNLMVDFYTRGAASVEKSTNSSLFFLQRLTEISSDVFFNVPALFLARTRASYGMPNFVYVNSFFNSKQYPPGTPLQAATHANSYPYMNGLFPVGEFEFNEQDRKFQNNLVDVLVRFVVEGRPAPDWPPITLDSFNFAHFDETADWRLLSHVPFEESFEFWSKLNDLSDRPIFQVSPQAPKKTEL